MRKAVAATVTSGDVTHLDPAKSYTVALVDYPARAAYKLSADKTVDTGRDVRDVVIAYLGKRK